jgi:hypothetical protein
MLSTGKISTLPWGHRRDCFIGASCLLFSFPLVVPWYFHGQKEKNWWPRWLVVTGCSLCSDYLYCGTTSYWHIADLWSATITFVIQFYRASKNFSWPIVFAFVPAPVYCKYMARVMSAKNDFLSYRMWHIAWHIVGVAYLTIIEWAALKRMPVRPKILSYPRN